MTEEAKEAKKLKGVVVFFVNLYPDMGQDVYTTMKMIKEMNKPLTDNLSEDGQYVVLFVPTTKEASRVEKVDYDSPFPRYMPKSHDIMKVGLQDGLKKKKKKGSTNMFLPPTKSLGGVISLFVNFWPEMQLDMNEIMKLVYDINKEALEQVQADGQYVVLIVPTTKEASRVEKADYDMPFPRFVPKSTGKKGVPTKVVTTLIGDDDEDDEDEDDDELEDEKKDVEDDLDDEDDEKEEGDE